MELCYSSLNRLRQRMNAFKARSDTWQTVMKFQTIVCIFFKTEVCPARPSFSAICGVYDLNKKHVYWVVTLPSTLLNTEAAHLIFKATQWGNTCLYLLDEVWWVALNEWWGLNTTHISDSRAWNFNHHILIRGQVTRPPCLSPLRLL